MKKIYLVDVSSLFFRAFYAIRPLTSTQGVPVNAVYGFISMITKLIKEKSPEYILFCYDRKEPSFRKDLYDDYKANRTEMPTDLQVQMPYLKKVADLFGIADLEVPGFEADDLIGTVAQKASAQGYQVFIVSGDKDFSQLVNENIFIYDTMKEFIYTAAAVKEKHGVHPEQFIDFLAITGDTSDHIPGVAGVGPKGAQKLIEQFGTLESIYENIDKVTPQGVKEKLIHSKDNAFLSKKLVTIVTDVPLAESLESYKLKPFKVEELRAFLQDLNFKSFEKSLLGDGQQGFHELSQTAQEAGKTKGVGHQIEASSSILKSENFKDEDSNKSTAVTLSRIELETDVLQARLKNEKFFSFLHQNQIHFIFNSSELISPTAFQLEQLDLSHLRWTGFDIKAVWHWLDVGLQTVSQYQVDDDLMLMSYCLKAQDATDCIDLINKVLNIEIVHDKKNPLDALIVGEKLIQLYNYTTNELGEKNLKVIYEKLEKPLIPILFAMEKQGILIDSVALKNFSTELEQQILELEKSIHEIAGEKFNIASPKQLGVILFEKLGLDALKKTKTGYSTDNEVLEKLNHPIAQKLIEYRELTKLKSTYVDALPDLAGADHRIHTHFNQALTTTGRLSSTNPNLQNIPIKTEKGQRVRQAFISEPSKKLLSLDYSQIELRILAHISNDAGLIQAFQNDLDIHAATAAEVFSVKVDQVSKEQRRIAKAVNFGIAYGQGAYGLAETLGISRSESKDIIEKYFKKFKGIKDYIENTIEEAHKNKFVETLFGRRRYLSELNSTNAMVKKFGERAAINAPIQGTASDLVKLAMIDVQRNLMQSSTSIKLLLQVHDELIFEGQPEELVAQEAQIKVIMENVARLKVPLKVNSSIGQNWDQAH